MSRDRLIIVEEAPSTQDIAYEMALRGATEGVAVMALRQTSGRGRLGRLWSSPAGKNLALSLILRPSCDPGSAPLYGLMAAVATIETVQSYCPEAVVQVKWPNDVIVSDKKIAGILPQAHVSDRTIEFVIIGLGLNVNSTRDDFPEEIAGNVTSMAILSGRNFSLEEIAHSFLNQMNRLYDHSRKDGFQSALEIWNSKWAHRGHHVNRDGIQGTAVGINETGALLIMTRNHGLVNLSSGEVNIQDIETKH